jgi:hypothetical protein
MVVWGGYGGPGSPTLLASGGRYDPPTDSWTPTALSGAPSARLDPTSVWTGTDMIVWGGSSGGTNYVNTGGRYGGVWMMYVENDEEIRNYIGYIGGGNPW